MNSEPGNSTGHKSEHRAVAEGEWQTHPFVRGMNTDLLLALERCAMPATFEAGQLIFREGEIANRFYLLLDGQVQLEAESHDFPAVTVAELGAGEVLGWSWLFAPYNWNFTARAVAPVRAMFFYGTWLREQSERDPVLGYELMKRTATVLMRRLQVTRQQLIKAVR